MLSKLKALLKNPKLMLPLITAILGIFGFTAGTEIKEQLFIPAPEVTIDITVPEHEEHKEHSHKHSHPELEKLINYWH